MEFCDAAGILYLLKYYFFISINKNAQSMSFKNKTRWKATRLLLVVPSVARNLYHENFTAMKNDAAGNTGGQAQRPAPMAGMGLCAQGFFGHFVLSEWPVVQNIMYDRSDAGAFFFCKIPVDNVRGYGIY